jgi:hypothetical protein
MSKVQEAETLLQNIQENLDQNSASRPGKLDDSILIRLFQEKLKSKAVMNKGKFEKTYCTSF